MLGRSELCALGCFLISAPALRAVTPLRVGAILQHKANYFDLEHKRLRFLPRGPAAYDVTSSGYPAAIRRGTALGKPTDPKGYSWRTRLPFAFPFAGRKWNELYINLNGSLTFDAPEAKQYPEREEMFIPAGELPRAEQRDQPSFPQVLRSGEGGRPGDAETPARGRHAGVGAGEPQAAMHAHVVAVVVAGEAPDQRVGGVVGGTGARARAWARLPPDLQRACP